MGLLPYVIGGFGIAAIIAYALTPLTGKLAHRFGILDHPSTTSHKRHSESTPYLGGVAIFGGLAGGAGFVIVAGLEEGVNPVRTFGLFLLSALGLGLVGLLDDIRPIPRTVRFCAHVAAASGAWVAGFQIGIAPWPVLNFALTLLWIVGITNAFNLLDNMDGLTAGVAGVAAISFSALGLLAKLPLLPVFSAALGGAALGFLWHNKHPAKIFMGDAGS